MRMTVEKIFSEFLAELFYEYNGDSEGNSNSCKEVAQIRERSISEREFLEKMDHGTQVSKYLLDGAFLCELYFEELLKMTQSEGLAELGASLSNRALKRPRDLKRVDRGDHAFFENPEEI
jgi:hypothetical protein